MDDFLKMDIFFVTATVSLILVAALLCLMLFYLTRILRTIDRISSDVEEEAKAIRADITEVRTKFKKEGVKLSQIVDFFSKTKKRIKKIKKGS